MRPIVDQNDSGVAHVYFFFNATIFFANYIGSRYKNLSEVCFKAGAGLASVSCLHAQAVRYPSRGTGVFESASVV